MSLELNLDVSILEMLTSKICHDLISPVGAVHNGVEFLQETADSIDAEAVALIAHSGQIASARLQAFRLAYGAGGRDSHIKPEDVYNIFEALTKGDGKVVQEWDPHAPVGFDLLPSGYCKILMGALMLAQECLPKGGSVAVRAGEDADQTHIIAEGPNAGIRPRFEEALTRSLPPEDIDPRLVHAYVLSLLSAVYGLEISITEQSPGRVAFSLGRQNGQEVP